MFFFIVPPQFVSYVVDFVLFEKKRSTEQEASRSGMGLDGRPSTVALRLILPESPIASFFSINSNPNLLSEKKVFVRGGGGIGNSQKNLRLFIF